MRRCLEAKEKKSRLLSIYWKILLPMSIVMLLQALLFSGVILFGGVLEKLDDNAFDILNGRVVNRRDFLEYEMVMRWSDLSHETQWLNSEIQQQLTKQGKDFTALGSDTKLAEEMLANLAPGMVDLLRKNTVTGVFLILNNDVEKPLEGENDLKPCLYIRDTDPDTTISNNSDLLLLCAPVSVSRQMGIPLDPLWRSQMIMDASRIEENTYDFYYKPMQAAVNYRHVNPNSLGYWSGVFQLDETAAPMISYSVPLRDAQGNLYGLLGIDLSVEHLNKKLMVNELGSSTGGYWLGVTDQQGSSFQKIAAYGAFEKSEETLLLESEPVYADIYRLENQEGRYGAVQYINLYERNAPFEEERWALVGVMNQSELLGFTQGVRNAVMIAFALSLGMGLAGVLLASKLLSKPVKVLVEQIEHAHSEQQLSLSKTNILEIDLLTKAAERFSRRAVESASKFAKIIEMSGIPIGAFEFNESDQTVVYTGRFFDIMQIIPPEGKTQEEQARLFMQEMQKLESCVEEVSNDQNKKEIIFSRITALGEKSWVSLRLVQDGARTLGVATDVTRQILQRQKLERERDYDLLTGLYSRRAFNHQLARLFDNPDILKIGAAIMVDLDNLKYINDTYGHDFGDIYLQGTASRLKRNTPSSTVVARMSGDEFYVFYYGYDDEEALRAQIDRLCSAVREANICLPDGSLFRVRMSAGIAWYPKDSANMDELLRYADFAMYKVKNTTKGQFSEFNQEVYDREAYLFRNKEDLNHLIEEQLVEYYFQPIVDVQTGEAYAYEALMRSTLPALRSPLQVMNLARNQFKMYQIELLTWTKALEYFDRVRTDLVPGARVFINSIANQTLNDADLSLLESKYSHLLQLVVVEITEGEQLDEHSVTQKKERVKKWNCGFALDDFGTGYNSDVALISLTPDFVKIDMSIVRGCDTDLDRQTILKNLISYSKERNIKVIAEGVETLTEMDILIGFGVDYIQGFYAARPALVPGAITENVREEMKACYKRWHSQL